MDDQLTHADDCDRFVHLATGLKDFLAHGRAQTAPFDVAQAVDKYWRAAAALGGKVG